MTRNASAAHRPDMATVICSDKNLFWQGVFFLRRAVSFDPHGASDYYYYINDPAPDWVRLLLPPQVRIVETDWRLDESSYQTSNHITQATFLRLHAMEELSTRYQKVCYSDIDIFQRWGSFTELAALDLGDFPIAAVRDDAFWGQQAEHWMKNKYVAHLPGDIGERYFNAGIVVANGPVYSDMAISQNALSFLADHKDICRYGDQSALNAVIKGRWAELSYSWNWQHNRRYDWMIPSRNPRFVHFVGPVKPWRDRFLIMDEMYRAEMSRFLRDSGLDELGFSIPPFDQADERRRGRILTERGADFSGLREFVKPFLSRQDFVDLQAGLAV